MRTIRRLLLRGLWILVLAGCSGKGGGGGAGIIGPGPGGGTSGPMSAKIDGVTWNADPLIAGQGAIHSAPGAYLIAGYKMVSGTNAQFLTISLSNIKATGAFPLGVTPQVFGGFGQFGDANGGWSTPLSGIAGTITITTLTSSRIAGTFSFTADAIFGTATGSKNVTEGTFDYPVITSGTVGPLPDNAGGHISATLGGTSWNGSTAQAQLATLGGNSVLIAGGLSTTGWVNFTVTGLVGPGTYALNNTTPLIMLTVTDQATGHSWGGSIHVGTGGTPITDDTGSIVFASVTATRVKGTFTGTLAPAPGSAAPGPLAVTGGEFDIGLP